jgi:hypothetical protein
LSLHGTGLYHDARSLLWALEFLAKGTWDILHEVFPGCGDEVAAIFGLVAWVLLSNVSRLVKLGGRMLFVAVVVRLVLLLMGAL